ncbi:MAG: Rho termination factor N-terminal domain-containing protein [Acidimicrobiales bacterium]
MNTPTATLETRMTTTLDEIEERLPPLSASVLRLERSIAGRSYDAVAHVVENVHSSARTVSRRTDHAVRTVFGTAKRAVDTTLSSATTGARTTSGQATAQAQRVGDGVASEVADGYDGTVGAVKSAIRAVDTDDDATTGYDRWTKADLYEKATELDIDGRSSMSKSELLAAVRSH